MSIETFGDLRGWFRERLETALGRRQLQAGEGTRAYLVDLLARVGLGQENDALSRPLALQLAEARAAERAERVRLYRALGDDALYLRGFCTDHLDHRGITTEYVSTLGETAYGQAGDLTLGSASEIYRELARKFEAFADALDDVREGTALRTPSDIVRLYDKWTRTHSPKIAERLTAEGVFPSAFPSPLRARGTVH
ncbi:MAG: hypothetical protein U0234_01715 [Sandaracinus sp.]